MSAERKKAFIVALTKLAIRRQAEVDTAALTIYAEDLVDAAVGDKWILQACDTLGRLPRLEFESAFPPVGNIIAKAEQILHLDLALRREVVALQVKQLSEPTHAESMEWLAQIKLAAHGRGNPDV
jgi:hypothetical protein